MKIKAVVLGVAMGLSVLGGTASASGIPVIDVANLAQAVQQYTQMVQQLQNLQAQLSEAKKRLQQAKDQYESITGGRGMENLLGDLKRNVIPENWDSVLDTVGAGEALGDLTNQIRDAHNLVSYDYVDTLPGLVNDMYYRQANMAATQQATAATVYDNASSRFERINELVEAVGDADDLKAIEDLQGRISAEQVMLQNELVKMQALAALAESQKTLAASEARDFRLRAVSGKEIKSIPVLSW